MKKYLLTFGLATVLIFALVLTPFLLLDPAETAALGPVGETVGRAAVPIVLGALGFFWRRHQVIGYWIVFFLILGLMAFGARS